MRPDASLPPRAAKTETAVFRRASSADVEELAAPSPEEIQRWTARRRTALVLSILKGEMTVEDVAARHGLAVAEVEEWKERLLAAAHNALRSRPRDEDALRDEQIRRLKQKVGELVLEVDQLREAMRGTRVAAADEPDE